MIGTAIFDGKFKCPNCNSGLDFDKDIGKYRCPACGKIWSFTIESRKITIHEWHEWANYKPYEWPKPGSLMYYELGEDGDTTETVDELKKLLKLDL